MKNSVLRLARLRREIHLALRTTPAQAAGVEQSIRTVADRIEACGEMERKK